MNIKLTKKQAIFMMACVLEIDQARFWYNNEVDQMITKTPKAQTMLSELIAEFRKQSIDTDDDDWIYTKYLVEVEAKK